MNNMPKKPETHEEQTSVLWDVMCNHVMSKLKTQDIKLNFVLGFMGLVLVLIGLILAFIIGG
ncbi:hypothetical protein LCGC14_0567170 [marine sediment metagenome]|uniref:Uncharacterized protein n=1 Tax=marine sediment metagenome TaxID=412755 RepID=A0A0F9RK50_9ZZZZ